MRTLTAALSLAFSQDQHSDKRLPSSSNNRTWNTGNGSPDAICFSVDRPGIFIVGTCVYGGMGTYEYELELLDDQSSGITEKVDSHSSQQRWTSQVIFLTARALASLVALVRLKRY